MFDSIRTRVRLYRLSQLRTRELRQLFAEKGLDFSSLTLKVHAALVADAMVNDAATAVAKYEAWMSSSMTWQQLTSAARQAGAAV